MNTVNALENALVFAFESKMFSIASEYSRDIVQREGKNLGSKRRPF